MLKNIIPLILFFLLTPGILWTYSKKHNKYSIAILHAFVFAFIFYFINETFSNTPIREGLEKNDKRFGFKLFSGLKKDKAVERKIKQVYGNKTRIEYTSKKEDEKEEEKAKKKGRKAKEENFVFLMTKDDKTFNHVYVTRDEIMERPNNEKINNFIKANEDK